LGYAGEHQNLGNMLEANDAHKDRVRQLGTPARRDSAMSLPGAEYASVVVSLDAQS
jgi:hypothetical protein